MSSYRRLYFFVWKTCGFSETKLSKSQRIILYKGTLFTFHKVNMLIKNGSSLLDGNFTVSEIEVTPERRVKLITDKSTAHGRATLKGSAIPASRCLELLKERRMTDRVALLGNRILGRYSRVR